MRRATKLKIKAFIIIELAWIAFLILAAVFMAQLLLPAYIATTFFLSLLIYFILYQQVLTRLETRDPDNKRIPIPETTSIETPIDMQESKFTQMSHYDDLTSLPNRIFFNEILHKALNHAKRHKKTLAILVVNLDSFKNINTTFSNVIGDSILKEIAVRFSQALREEDILARLDNDEFIILLSDIGKPKYASAVAEKLLNACTAPFTIQGHTISLTISIGVCIYPNDGDSLETLMQNVSEALEIVKQSGGGGCRFYAKDIDAEANEYIQLKDALHKAMYANELALYFQPEYHLKHGNIVAVEALLRWHHPQLGLVYPSKFISLAEEAGMIMQIGEWVLYEACRINKLWQDEGYERIRVGVNLSSKQFYHPDIVTVISNVLKNTQLNPNYLELEISETTIMDNVAIANEILEKIKATGVQISIAHFGVGYTSISHLKQFPINAIKIDPSFVKGIPHTPNDIAIINAFIALAHHLGLEVIAEGVETEEQVQHLAAQNCDIVQGYFLSHPVPAQKITNHFTKLTDRVLV